MMRIILSTTLFLAISTATAFLIHPQANRRPLFSPQFSHPIELVETSSIDNKCSILTADGDNHVILENIDSTAWVFHPSASQNGCFLTHVPCSKHTSSSSVDVKLGDWPINHRNKGEDEVKWLACARQTRYWMGPSFQTHQIVVSRSKRNSS